MESNGPKSNFLRNFLITLGIVGIVISFSISIWLVGSRDNNLNPVTKASADSVQLSLNPAAGSLSKDQSATLGITLYGGTKIVNGIDIVLQYDPLFWSATNNKLFSTSLFEKVIVNEIDPKNGLVKFSATTATPAVKTGIVASFSLTPIRTGQTSITFDRKNTGIWEAKTLQNVVSEVVNGDYILSTVSIPSR